MGIFSLHVLYYYSLVNHIFSIVSNTFYFKVFSDMNYEGTFSFIHMVASVVLKKNLFIQDYNLQVKYWGSYPING